ncbi:MAG: hypothetical protein H6937_00050 [Burkholderiales bacterium]|nr:hypothetical protein [Burkholderiales bacterium]
MFSKLYNHYWFIRYARNSSAKRRYYRYVEKEKKRLLVAGIDPEELRLLCRHLDNLRNRHAGNASNNTGKSTKQFHSFSP